VEHEILPKGWADAHQDDGSAVGERSSTPTVSSPAVANGRGSAAGLADPVPTNRPRRQWISTAPGDDRRIGPAGLWRVGWGSGPTRGEFCTGTMAFDELGEHCAELLDRGVAESLPQLEFHGTAFR